MSLNFTYVPRVVGITTPRKIRWEVPVFGRTTFFSSLLTVIQNLFRVVSSMGPRRPFRILVNWSFVWLLFLEKRPWFPQKYRKSSGRMFLWVLFYFNCKKKRNRTFDYHQNFSYLSFRHVDSTGESVDMNVWSPESKGYLHLPVVVIQEDQDRYDEFIKYRHPRIGGESPT